MQVLQDADGRAERSQQLAKRPEHPVTIRPRIARGSGLRGKHCRELGQQGSKRPDHRGHRATERLVAEAAQCLNDRPKEKGFAQAVTVPEQNAPLLGRAATDCLAHESTLADSGLALDEDQGGRIDHRLTQDGHLSVPTDQRGRGDARRRGTARLHVGHGAHASALHGSVPGGPAASLITFDCPPTVRPPWPYAGEYSLARRSSSGRKSRCPGNTDRSWVAAV